MKKGWGLDGREGTYEQNCSPGPEEPRVIADGPARQVVCHSPVFAPQVAKVLAPEEWLTVDEVRQALSKPVPA